MFFLTTISFVTAGDINSQDGSVESLTINQAVNIAKEQLFIKEEVEGINGLSWTDDEAYKIIVYVESEEYIKNVPSTIAGYETEVKVIGQVWALGTKQLSKSKPIDMMYGPRWQYRNPICGGLAIGTNIYLNYYGTLCVVTEPDSQVTNPENYILSCAHVLAQRKRGVHVTRPYSKVKVYQPAILQGGLHKIGYLKDYVKLNYYNISRPNNIDAAIAVLYDYQDAEYNAVLGNNDKTTYQIKYSCVTPPASPDVFIRKSGATTGVKYSWITDKHANLKVCYYALNQTEILWAWFEDVILVYQSKHNLFVDAGDSGSFVDYPDGGNSFVGIAFAGSDDVAVVCKSSYIISELGLNKKAKSRSLNAIPLFEKILDRFPLFEKILNL